MVISNTTLVPALGHLILLSLLRQVLPGLRQRAAIPGGSGPISREISQKSMRISWKGGWILMPEQFGVLILSRERISMTPLSMGWVGHRRLRMLPIRWSLRYGRPELIRSGMRQEFLPYGLTCFRTSTSMLRL